MEKESHSYTVEVYHFPREMHSLPWPDKMYDLIRMMGRFCMEKVATHTDNHKQVER